MYYYDKCKPQSLPPFDCVLVRVRDHEIHSTFNSHTQAREDLGEVVCIIPFPFYFICKHLKTLTSQSNVIGLHHLPYSVMVLKFNHLTLTGDTQGQPGRCNGYPSCSMSILLQHYPTILLASICVTSPALHSPRTTLEGWSRLLAVHPRTASTHFLPNPAAPHLRNTPEHWITFC